MSAGANEKLGFLRQVDLLVLFGALVALFVALGSEPWWTLTGTATNSLLSVQVSPFYLHINALGLPSTVSAANNLGCFTILWDCCSPGEHSGSRPQVLLGSPSDRLVLLSLLLGLRISGASRGPKPDQDRPRESLPSPNRVTARRPYPRCLPEPSIPARLVLKQRQRIQSTRKGSGSAQ